MASRLFIPLRSLLLACLLSASALADDGPGTQAVRRANDSVKALLEQKAEPGSAAEKRRASQISVELEGFLDVNELGERALGQHLERFRPAQRKEFLTLLRDLVEANYIKAMRSNASYAVRYLTEEEQNDGSRVVATELSVQRSGRSEVMSVDYRLLKRGEQWRAFDLVTDGVGLVENYRAQFNQIIAKEGVDGLLERMRRKKVQNG
ncbi:MAG TPA: ABC transporter substrate-binding protein [Polyangiaceae bacterium]|nr:ABC transporter substrate-binding protein [Polyangiaceae bacterium]